MASEPNAFLCPIGTCRDCDDYRRAEREARCPLRPAREGDILAIVGAGVIGMCVLLLAYWLVVGV